MNYDDRKANPDRDAELEARRERQEQERRDADAYWQEFSDS